MVDEFIFVCLGMDENIGRGRHGRDSRTHGSARREIPPAPKRPRRKKVQQAETGGSASRTRRSQVDEPVQDDVYDTNQYINQNADWLEQEQPEQAIRWPCRAVSSSWLCVPLVTLTFHSLEVT